MTTTTKAKKAKKKPSVAREPRPGGAEKRSTKKGASLLENARAATERARAESVRKAESAIARMLRLKQSVEEAFYDFALQLQDFRDEKRHVGLGYATFYECIEDREIIGRDAAQKLLAIVDAGVSRETALEYGSYERTYASLKLTRRTKREDDSPETLIREKKTVGGVPATRAPVRAFAAEARESEGRAGTNARRLSAEDREAAALAGSLRAALSGVPGVEAAVRAKRGRLPRVLVELTFESAKALADRLRKKR